MLPFRWEIFEDVISSGPCSVTKAGPIRVPITSLSIRRNENRELILSTTSPADSTSAAAQYPAGTVRQSDELIEFSTPSGFTAVGRGVIPHRWSRSLEPDAGSGATQEESSLHSLVLTSQSGSSPKYTMEWG